MSVTEQQRRFLLDRLVEILGPEAASLMAEILPFQPSDELVTRSDLAATTTMLQGDMADLRSELRGEMADLRSELRGEMAELRGDFTELRGEFAELRGEMVGLKGEFAELRGEMVGLKGEFAGFRGEMKGEFFRWGAVIVSANAIAVVSALVN